MGFLARPVRGLSRFNLVRRRRRPPMGLVSYLAAMEIRTTIWAQRLSDFGRYLSLRRCRERTDVGTGGRSVHVAGFGGNTMTDGLLKIGIIGSVVAAVCCFTPLLVVLLGAIGLSGAVGILDYVLLPALVIFLAITGYALWKRKQTASN